MYVYYRISSRHDGFCYQFHVGLLRCSSSFFDVAAGAGTDEVVPCGFAAESSGGYVVYGKFREGESFAAVLAVVAVSCVNVSAVELYGFSGEPVVEQEPYDSRDGDVEIYG